MIHLPAVAELVDDDVVDNIGRHFHQETVEIEIALCSAGPPDGGLIADRDAAVRDTDDMRAALHAGRNFLHGSVRKISDFRRIDGRDGFRSKNVLTGSHFGKVGFDPIRVLRDKIIDSLLRGTVGRTDNHSCIACDFNSDGPA